MVMVVEQNGQELRCLVAEGEVPVESMRDYTGEPAAVRRP